MESVTPVSLADLTWAAGFLEGEGCFFAKSGHRFRSPGIRAAQVQRWPLEKLQRLFGGNIGSHRPTNPKHSLYYYWSIGGPRGAGVVYTLYTFLSPKRRDSIRDALRQWMTRPPHSRYRMACPKGHPYDEGRAGDGQRFCRLCRLEATRKWRDKKRRAA